MLNWLPSAGDSTKGDDEDDVKLLDEDDDIAEDLQVTLFELGVVSIVV